MTKVINLRDYPGAGMRRTLPEDVVRVDRFSKWGNPYKVDRTHKRGEAISLYRIWLEDQLRSNPNFLEPLRGKTLGCWCAPLACHADVIAEALDG